MKMIEKTFEYRGRVVRAFYKPEVLAEFEKVRHCYLNAVTNGPTSRAYLAEKIVDDKTGEVLKDINAT